MVTIIHINNLNKHDSRINPGNHGRQQGGGARVGGRPLPLENKKEQYWGPFCNFFLYGDLFIIMGGWALSPCRGLLLLFSPW